MSPQADVPSPGIEPLTDLLVHGMMFSQLIPTSRAPVMLFNRRFLVSPQVNGCIYMWLAVDWLKYMKKMLISNKPNTVGKKEGLV